MLRIPLLLFQSVENGLNVTLVIAHAMKNDSNMKCSECCIFLNALTPVIC